MPTKQNKCCCCFGCINNGSLVPACDACAGSGTGVGTGTGGGGEVPLRYEVLLDFMCCELQAGLITIATNSLTSGQCTWKNTFTCVLSPLITGKVVLTVTGLETEEVTLEIWFDETASEPDLRYVNGETWKCLCANMMYIDLPHLISHPIHPLCPSPESILCVSPLGDCCADDRGPANPMPRSLTATIVEIEDCPIANGATSTLTWNPVTYQYEGSPITVGDCEIQVITLRCTNFLSGSCADWEMDITYFRPGVGTVTITNWPASEVPLYDCSCDPFRTEFTEILNSFPCCPDPLSGPGVAPRASVLVTE